MLRTYSLRQARKSRPAHAGFTMAELLVAIALGLIILSIVAFCFHQASEASGRALALLEANHKARVALDLMKRDFEGLQPCCAIKIDDVDGDTYGDTITFMTALPKLDMDMDGTDNTMDLAWVRYTFVPEYESGVYSVGDFVHASTGWWYKCVQGGSSSAAPSGTTPGVTESDGDVIWECVGDRLAWVDDGEVRKIYPGLYRKILEPQIGSTEAPEPLSSATLAIESERFNRVLSGVLEGVFDDTATLTTPPLTVTNGEDTPTDSYVGGFDGLELDGSTIVVDLKAHPRKLTIAFTICGQDTSGGGNDQSRSFTQTFLLPGKE